MRRSTRDTVKAKVWGQRRKISENYKKHQISAANIIQDRKYTFDFYENEVAGSYGKVWILTEKLLNSRFCACAENVRSKLSSQVSNHQNFAPFIAYKSVDAERGGDDSV